MTSIPASRIEWEMRCSTRLCVRWRLDREERNDIAAELWNDERWQSMEPEEAAAEWLRQGLPDEE